MPEDRRRVLKQLAETFELMAHLRAIQSMDHLLYGSPREWPDHVLAKGMPVWVEVPGLPEYGVMAGIIDHSDVRHDAKGIREGRVGICVKRRLPITGQVTYCAIDSGTFWPRSIGESPASVQELATL